MEIRFYGNIGTEYLFGKLVGASRQVSAYLKHKRICQVPSFRSVSQDLPRWSDKAWCLLSAFRSRTNPTQNWNMAITLLWEGYNGDNEASDTNSCSWSIKSSRNNAKTVNLHILIDTCCQLLNWLKNKFPTLLYWNLKLVQHDPLMTRLVISKNLTLYQTFA